MTVGFKKRGWSLGPMRLEMLSSGVYGIQRRCRVWLRTSQKEAALSTRERSHGLMGDSGVKESQKAFSQLVGGERLSERIACGE